jgi:hypothetical protein
MSAQLKTTVKLSGALIRPRFEPGALLLDEDLTAIVDHTRGLSRLLFRSLFGCGVVCGFRVTAQVECGNLIVGVAPGVALDCHGDPIEMCGQQTLGMPCAERLPDRLWVMVRRAAREHTCAPRDVACPSDDSGAYKPTRAKDCFELTLTKDEPTHECGCPKPPGTAGTYARPAATADASSATEPAAMRLANTAAPATATATVNPVVIPRINTGATSAASGPAVSTTPPATNGGATVTPPGEVKGNTELLPPPDWECHIPHYCGVCSCGCCDSCGDGWVVLACVSTKANPKPGATGPANDRDVDYKVRRFIRPVLAADPLRYPERDTMCKGLLEAKPDGS